MYNEKDKITVYSSKSELKSFNNIFGQLFSDVKNSRELAYSIFTRDIKAQYRQSVLGFFWAIVPTIITALTFTLATRTNILNISETDIAYPAYVIFSTTLWQIFTECLMGPINATSGGKGIFTKIKFPKEALIMAKYGEILMNLCIKMVLIIVTFILFKVEVSPMVIIAPFALLSMALLGSTIGLFLAPVSLLYHDINRALTIVLGMALFLTPVVYPVPQGEGVFQTIVKINPVTTMLVGIRELTLHGYIPDLPKFLLLSAISLIGFIFAWIFYRLAMPYVIERA